MKGIQFARLADSVAVAGTGTATCTARREATSRPVTFDGFPLWAVRTELAAGAEIVWDGPHGDEGLYVMAGELAVGDRRCPAGGAVLVEAGVSTVVRTDTGASVVHVGPHDPDPPTEGRYGPPAPGPRGVHVIGPGGTFATVDGTRNTHMFADSTCGTCRITLFVSGRSAANTSNRHSHSADEILYVLHGQLSFGNQHLAPGDAVAIAADQPYAFQGSGSDGYAFLNYRRDVSEQTIGDAPPLLEGGLARGMTPVHDIR
jgi:quercetin dioxygenase-like cupin family protein